jgi:hypothetical protein
LDALTLLFLSFLDGFPNTVSTTARAVGLDSAGFFFALLGGKFNGCPIAHSTTVSLFFLRIFFRADTG